MKQVTNGRRYASLITVVTLLFFMTGIATAKTTAKEEKKLTSEITILDKDASGSPQGDPIVTDRLSKEFKVSGDQIKALRDKNMGLGEIAAVYAFADKMSGGVTDTNVDKVASLRQDNKGWTTIAKSLDVDLGNVASKVNSIEKDVHKDIKKAAKEKPAGSGAGGGGY
jgi:hypothetical protein